MDSHSKKFKVVTLGCRTNQYESQAYNDQLKKLGFEEAKPGENAELCIVNTCTVTESADSSSRHEIRQLARNNPGAKIVVTGCYAERQPDVIAKLEGVTHVIPNLKKDELIASLFPDENVPEFTIDHFEAHTRAFVKVQDGCNSFCTYCIIPYVRGRSRSKAVPEILSEIEALILNGFKEVVLTGINIGDFDGNPAEGEAQTRLSDLIRAVDKIKGIERIRVSSIDPDEIDDDLADAILNGKHTCQSMHVVLQSGSNVILKRMNRKYTRQIFLETVNRLREASPDFTFTTDVIVGFPGETDRDFQDTLDIIHDVQFAKIHMFPYSERPRTRAALFPNKVSPDVIKHRKQQVLRLAEMTSYSLREKYVGREMQILTEKKNEHSSLISGHTDNFLEVIVDNPNLEQNQLVTVRLLSNTPEGLIGKMI